MIRSVFMELLRNTAIVSNFSIQQLSSLTLDKFRNIIKLEDIFLDSI